MESDRELLELAAKSAGHAMTPTPRELEVAHLVAHGFSNKEIARKLGITPETVHTHMINILRKFGFRNRAEMWKLFFSAESQLVVDSEKVYN